MANSNVKSEVILPAEEGLPQPAPLMSLRLSGEPAKETTEIETPDNKAPAAKADTNPAPESPEDKKARLRRKVQALFEAPTIETEDEDEAEGDTDTDIPADKDSPLDEDKSAPPSGAHKVYREKAATILRDGLKLSLETFTAGDSDSAFALFISSASKATELLREAASAETAALIPSVEDLMAQAINEAFNVSAEHAATEDGKFFIDDEAATDREAVMQQHEADFALAETLAKLRKEK